MMFFVCDTNRSGTIYVSEIKNILNKLDLMVEQDSIDKILIRLGIADQMTLQ